MDNQALIAIAAQIPLVAAFFTALQKGWIYIGRNITDEREFQKTQVADKQRQIDELRAIHQKVKDELRADYQNQLAAANARAERERLDRLSADERTAKTVEILRDATEVMDRSVGLHEQAALGVAQNAARQRRPSTR
jgi:hypothetical protein